MAWCSRSPGRCGLPPGPSPVPWCRSRRGRTLRHRRQLAPPSLGGRLPWSSYEARRSSGATRRSAGPRSGVPEVRRSGRAELTRPAQHHADITRQIRPRAVLTNPLRTVRSAAPPKQSGERFALLRVLRPCRNRQTFLECESRDEGRHPLGLFEREVLGQDQANLNAWSEGKGIGHHRRTASQRGRLSRRV
jgi:hypothetical protein